jgi:hypothetical protein
MKQYQKRVCGPQLPVYQAHEQLTAVLDREQEIAKQALKEGNKVCLAQRFELMAETSINSTTAEEISRITITQD